MKHILLTLFIISVMFSSENTKSFPPVVVLELFTSQGCSSCPPADELLDTIQKETEDITVIGLSYHVDYWNYIGWKDPFSKKSFSEKQRQYSQKFNNSSMYTPQIVVNGSAHFVGSNVMEMHRKLRKYSKMDAENKVEITALEKRQGVIGFDYGILGDIDNKMLRTVLVIEERHTKIPRGENRNRTLKNSNIVVSESYTELKTSEGKVLIEIPDLVNNSDQLKLICVIQNTDLKIVGSSQLKL